MIAAGLVELVLGVNAAQRSLEDIATPLTAEEEGEDDERKPADRERCVLGSSLRSYHYPPPPPATRGSRRRPHTA